MKDPATSEIYTLSLHDALPIACSWGRGLQVETVAAAAARSHTRRRSPRACPPLRATPCMRPCGGCCEDRKSTRLNYGHTVISYAVFCLKEKIFFCHVSATVACL